MNDKIDKTTEDQANNEAQHSELSQSIGQILKSTRKSQNIEIEQVCSQLNLSSHVVEALESDNYEGLPEIAYVRGYIVSYCRLLGLDSFRVLQQLVTEDPSLSVSNSLGANHHISGQSAGSSAVKKVFPILLIGVIGATAFWFFSQKNITEPAPSTVNEAASSAAIDAPTASSVTPTPTTTDANQGATSTAAQPNTVDKAKESLLELEFNSVSWVDIQNLKKEKIVYQSFPRGEKHQVKTTLPLNVFIDNADGVFMRYEGRLIDLKPHIQDGYAKFTLSK